MSCEIKKIALASKIEVVNEKQSEEDFDNIMDLIHKMDNVGQADGILYEYSLSGIREDAPVDVVHEENFDPMMNASNNEENMFVVDGVVDEK